MAGQIEQISYRVKATILFSIRAFVPIINGNRPQNRGSVAILGKFPWDSNAFFWYYREAYGTFWTMAGRQSRIAFPYLAGVIAGVFANLRMDINHLFFKGRHVFWDCLFTGKILCSTKGRSGMLPQAPSRPCSGIIP